MFTNIIDYYYSPSINELTLGAGNYCQASSGFGLPGVCGILHRRVISQAVVLGVAPPAQLDVVN